MATRGDEEGLQTLAVMERGCDSEEGLRVRVVNLGCDREPVARRAFEE